MKNVILAILLITSFLSSCTKKVEKDSSDGRTMLTAYVEKEVPLNDQSCVFVGEVLQGYLNFTYLNPVNHTKYHYVIEKEMAMGIPILKTLNPGMEVVLSGIVKYKGGTSKDEFNELLRNVDIKVVATYDGVYGDSHRFKICNIFDEDCKYFLVSSDQVVNPAAHQLEIGHYVKLDGYPAAPTNKQFVELVSMVQVDVLNR